MKNLIILLILTGFLGCKKNETKIENSTQRINTIYNSNDVVNVDDVIYFKRDMTKVTGIIHGFHNNGKQSESYLVENGLKNDFSNSWNEEGQKRFEGKYKYGKQEGLWRFWWPNGQLKTESHYKNGMLNGTKKSWDIYGNLTADEVWLNNNRQ